MDVFIPSLKTHVFVSLFIYLAALGLCCCTRAFSSCGKWWGGGATLHCGVRASHCSGFSCCGAWVPRHLGPAVAAQGLNCPVACGIFPDQELDRCPLH